ncbi:XtrA/YqaO family protein [Marinococcus sp. PL1-022]|uniref:XtrA/YqaO family protein n=1 Tax=Marinococcus sp. PL1-022 TaxID=3095363 RepID=UPI0039B65EA9
MDLPEGNSPFCVVYCGGKEKITTLTTKEETKVITHQGKVKMVKSSNPLLYKDVKPYKRILTGFF